MVDPASFRQDHSASPLRIEHSGPTNIAMIPIKFRRSLCTKHNGIHLAFIAARRRRFEQQRLRLNLEKSIKQSAICNRRTRCASRSR